MSCDNGHLFIVEYLIKFANSINSPIDIHAYNEYAFRRSCQNGHSKIVEYLINYANSINSFIDIHAEEEYAFRLSCRKWTFEGC